MIRIGIIGCGGVSGGHVSGLDALEGVQVTALADIDLSRAKARQGQLSQPDQASMYRDYLDLLQKSQLDAVSICTPHYLHFEQAMAALEHGLHVLVEKPFTTDPEKDAAIIRAARSQNRKLAIRYQRHSLGTFRKAKEMIADGRIGRLETIIALLGQSWYRNQFKRIARDGDSWRIVKSKSGGGQIMDSGSHLIDAFLWVSGHRPTEVSAYTLNKDFEVDVCSALVVKTDQGALANVSINGDTPVGVGYFSLECCGDEGYLKVTNEELLFAPQGKEIQKIQHPPSSDCFRDFITAIRQDLPVAASGEDGLLADLVAQAGLRSAATRHPELCDIPEI